MVSHWLISACSTSEYLILSKVDIAPQGGATRNNRVMRREVDSLALVWKFGLEIDELAGVDIRPWGLR